MIKTLNAGLASLGLLATGILAAFVTTGALEGVASLPNWLPPVVGIALFFGTLGLAGEIAVELDPRRPLVATAIPSVIVLILGYAAVSASERGSVEGLEFEVVILMALGLAVMTASATLIARARARRRQSSNVAVEQNVE
ncbi:MAG: hypothetical protein OSA99_09345 [Acidimicrobiales bacterium]|nr:hypothetical protein [Acidimicrobiales bacterium]